MFQASRKYKATSKQYYSIVGRIIKDSEVVIAKTSVGKLLENYCLFDKKYFRTHYREAHKTHSAFFSLYFSTT
jgi:hypothetical protein